MRWTGTCKALGGEGDDITLAAEFVINIIADDQIGMNTNVLVRTEQGMVLQSTAQPDFAKFGNRGTGFEHSEETSFTYLLITL